MDFIQHFKGAFSTEPLPSSSSSVPPHPQVATPPYFSPSEMEQEEKHVTFALPSPSPSPPIELQQETQLGAPSQSQQQPVWPQPPPTLTAAQMMAHAQTLPKVGGSINDGPSDSAFRRTFTWPRLREIPDGNPMSAVDSNTSWPGGVIVYQRLPSCYDSQEDAGGPMGLVYTAALGSASASSSAAPRVSNATPHVLGNGPTVTPRLKHGNTRLVSASGGTNPRPPPKSNQPRTWEWTPGTAAVPIYDPDYADGPPPCLAPRPVSPGATTAVLSALNRPRPTGRSVTIKRLRGGGEATPPVEHEDTRSNVRQEDTWSNFRQEDTWSNVRQEDTMNNVRGSSSTGSYVAGAGSDQVFSTEVGDIGPIGTVESIWGERLSEFRGLRV